MDPERLKKQIDFIVEIDKLKHILRRTVLIDKSRRENDAEHSWHLAVMAILLKEYAAEDVDLEKVMKMVLVHDLVEIDAGDTFCYDAKANLDKRDRELCAADRLFAILPEDQAKELRRLWEEFEECTTPEARFAASLDRLQPFIHNVHTDGHTWKNGVTSDQVHARMAEIRDGAPELWEVVNNRIEDCIERGILTR
jgi:putative hydrolase of HD superfamily